MVTKHYPLGAPGAENFIADTLVEALAEVVAWLSINPNISVLSISTNVLEDRESATVFYEC